MESEEQRARLNNIEMKIDEIRKILKGMTKKEKKEELKKEEITKKEVQNDRIKERQYE